MGNVRLGHATVFRTRADRLRAIAVRLDEQAASLAAGGEQSFLMSQAREFLRTARQFEADAAVIERLSPDAALSHGRTVFVADTPSLNDTDARAGRVRISY